MLEKIYVVRHGYRSNWVVNSTTGEYTSSVRTPTGIAADPPLAGYGEIQARELATHLTSIQPPVDVIFSSPYYRCLQTLSPTVTSLRKSRQQDVRVRIEHGLAEFFGRAHFTHPRPAALDVLSTHFDFIDHGHTKFIESSVYGESIEALHARLAYTLHRLIEMLDAEQGAPRTLLICSHAASMIAMGRVLTGRMPEDPNEEDFRVGTCSLSVYERRAGQGQEGVETWDESRPEAVPELDWQRGKGVGGGWNCVANGDCSFLQGGEEKTWRFSGDESFLKDPNAYNEKMNQEKEKATGASRL
ncbi:phosphoglycerate mutase-like protein [Pseudovirgaria hyperparasitica]|uniref:Phosphoglycerate mutase-like protein n=1 Tax=Pseudovirgaria hyperparasitica TaxID=470096 RepID=A0A6A6W4T6_9PEZI|nr:phosphoglycerate mutase-like protein [Pseudovirgaria hyperparasitica]KAF2757189.1 phosphoglycerate mutase-like protein [Pseudovirgaria hyperparasitica]